MSTPKDEPKAPETKPAAKSNLPQVKETPLPQIKIASAPADDEYTDGIFVSKADGEEYALAIHGPDTYGNTHSLKNSLHTWQGTEAAFDAEFAKSK